jgi:hypothetical protein
MTSLSEEENSSPIRFNGQLSTGIGAVFPDGSFYPFIRLNNQIYGEYKNFSAEIYVDVNENNKNYSPYKVIKEESLLDKYALGNARQLLQNQDSIEYDTTQDFDSSEPTEDPLNMYKRLFKLLGDSLTSNNVKSVTKLLPKVALLMNRANVKFKSDYVNIILGKQVIAWGSAYAWNPTDVINNKNPSDPTRQPKGVMALNFDISPRENLLLSGVFAPGENFETSNSGLRFKFFGNNSDIALSWAYKGNRLINNSLPDNTLFTFGLDYNLVTNKGHNIWFEAAYEQPFYKGKKDTLNGKPELEEQVNIQSMIGYQYAFSKVRLITELYYNHIGYSPKNRPKILDNGTLVSSDTTKSPDELLLKTLMGEIAGTGFMYYDLGLLYTINRHHSIRAFGLLNLADYSFIIRPEYEISPLQNVKVNFTSAIFIGNKEKTELGSFKSNISFSISYLF